MYCVIYYNFRHTFVPYRPTTIRLINCSNVHLKLRLSFYMY